MLRAAPMSRAQRRSAGWEPAATSSARQMERCSAGAKLLNSCISASIAAPRPAFATLPIQNSALLCAARSCRHPDIEDDGSPVAARSEEHTSELQSLMRISYAVFCLKKKKHKPNTQIDSSTHDTTLIKNPTTMIPPRH